MVGGIMARIEFQGAENALFGFFEMVHFYKCEAEGGMCVSEIWALFHRDAGGSAGFLRTVRLGQCRGQIEMCISRLGIERDDVAEETDLVPVDARLLPSPHSEERQNDHCEAARAHPERTR